MAANIDKIKTCVLALITFIKNGLTLKFPIWLFLVAFLAAVLFGWLVSCTAAKSSVQTAIVGYTEYRGHTFLVFRAINGGDPNFSVVHDPDCECHLVTPVNAYYYGSN